MKPIIITAIIFLVLSTGLVWTRDFLRDKKLDECLILAKEDYKQIGNKYCKRMGEENDCLKTIEIHKILVNRLEQTEGYCFKKYK